MHRVQTCSGMSRTKRRAVFHPFNTGMSRSHAAGRRDVRLDEACASPDTHERCTYGPRGIFVLLAPRERKVVYAEDDDLFRSVVTQMLTSAGIEVHECR